MSTARLEAPARVPALDTRRARRGAPRALVLVAAVAIAGIGAYAGTNVSASLAQRDLRERWAAAVAAAQDAGGAAIATRTFAPGSPVARLVVPAIKLDLVVVEGGNGHRGPAHLPASAVPGSFGVAVITAGRFGFGNFFLGLERLRVGDEIVVEDLSGARTYRVTEVRTVPSARLTIGEDSNDRVLELVGAARVWGDDRILVRAVAGGGA